MMKLLNVGVRIYMVLPISNCKPLPPFLGFQGQSHNSLEDARMTARVYESFLESDQARELLGAESSLSNNPFGGLDLSQLFD